MSRWGSMFGLVMLAIGGFPALDRFLPGRNDFLQLYGGARLSGTPQLYEPAASKKIEMELVGVWLEGVYYSRPPFYAFLLGPLVKLPYLTAYWLFPAISVGAFTRDVSDRSAYLQNMGDGRPWPKTSAYFGQVPHSVLSAFEKHRDDTGFAVFVRLEKGPFG
jgi:hypothetical protein